MAIRTKQRLSFITGSFWGSGSEGYIRDGRPVQFGVLRESLQLHSASMVGIMSEVVSAIRRINGGRSFAGAPDKTIAGGRLNILTTGSGDAGLMIVPGSGSISQGGNTANGINNIAIVASATSFGGWKIGSGSNLSSISQAMLQYQDKQFSFGAYQNDQKLMVKGSLQLGRFGSIGASISGSSGAALMISGSSTHDVGIHRFLTVHGQQIKASDGTTNLTLTNAGNVTVAGKGVFGGDTAASDAAAVGYTAAEGIIITGQGSTSDVTIKNDADTLVLDIKTGTTQVDLAGNLLVGGNVIKASDGGSTITMDTSDNVTIAGDLTVTGNDIKGSGGTAITMDGNNQITLAGNAISGSGGANIYLSGSGNVGVQGDLIVWGGDIKGAAGAQAISMNSSGDVSVSGDLTVGGSDIKGPSGTNMTLGSGGNVQVAGDLDVEGNDITFASSGNPTIGAAVGSSRTITIGAAAGTVTAAGKFVVNGNLDTDADDISVFSSVGSGNTIQIGASGSNVKILGNLIVSGATYEQTVTEMRVVDPVILFGSGSVTSNSNGGLALASGSSVANQSLVVGRIANNTWGVGRLDTLNGDLDDLSGMKLVPIRANSIELENANNKIGYDAANTTLFMSASADIDIFGGGSSKVTIQGNQSSSGTAIHLDGDAGAYSIVDIDAGQLFMDATNSVTLTSKLSTLLLSGTQGVNVSSDAGEIDITARQGLIDINATEGAISASAGAGISLNTTSDTTTSFLFEGFGYSFNSGDQNDVYKFNDAPVSLAQISAPSSTTDKLYNIAGKLYWNGAELESAAATSSGKFIYSASANSPVSASYADILMNQLTPNSMATTVAELGSNQNKKIDVYFNGTLLLTSSDFNGSNNATYDYEVHQTGATGYIRTNFQLVQGDLIQVNIK